MALPSTLLLCLTCLLLCRAAPKPSCDPSACRPCPDGDAEGTATPAAGCCPPCPGGDAEGTATAAAGCCRPCPGGDAEGTATAAAGCCRPCPDGDAEGTATPAAGCCRPCPEGDAEGTATPAAGCCPPCPEGDAEGTATPAAGCCRPCPEGDAEGTATAAAGCCRPCPPRCPCPPHLRGECEMQGFSSIPAGRSFYIDFARSLCTCQPSGHIACVPRCPRPHPACRALGSPLADGCPRCVCYGPDELPVPAGSVTARGSQTCTCPARGGQLLCSAAGGEQ